MNTFQILSLLGVGSLILSIYGLLYRQFKKNVEEFKALKLGLQAVLRAQMVDDYNRYSEKGWAPIYAKQNFENCWLQYEALGANGVMSDIHAKFMALPDKRADKEEKT